MSESSEKRQEILRLLAEGKIDATEAAELLSTTDRPEPEATADPGAVKITKADLSASASSSEVSASDGPTWLHVRVSDLTTGKGKVTVNIPLRLLKAGLTIGSRFAPELQGMEWSDITTMLESEKGVLVDVQDDEDGEHVQIYVD